VRLGRLEFLQKVEIWLSVKPHGHQVTIEHCVGGKVVYSRYASFAAPLFQFRMPTLRVLIAIASVNSDKKRIPHYERDVGEANLQSAGHWSSFFLGEPVRRRHSQTPSENPCEGSRVFVSHGGCDEL
jgi:hypothetical protein